MFKPIVLASAMAVAALAFAPALQAGSIVRKVDGDSCRTGPTGSAHQCAREYFCEPKAGQCGTTSAVGTCTRVSKVCTMNYQPVCGCNGNTYGNDCERRAHQVGKKHDGAC